ncbi:winged helix-turn-helix domain-containing protein [Micromonospora aurantiaca]|uniref:winged helix-turn-helix domain-containing protein n=1 Tax=Micromonospora aurantiaca (nom. illeg.) TaxID=47850 RepID=UPI0034175679
MPRHMTYRQIADDLAARIAAGEYPPDAKLPSYTQLAALYSVSVATIQRALLVLEVKDLVRGHVGRGVYVTATTTAEELHHG